MQQAHANFRAIFSLYPDKAGVGKILGRVTAEKPNLVAKYPADVEVETLPDGAALITLCEEPFGKGDAAGLARLHALEAALRPIQS